MRNKNYPKFRVTKVDDRVKLFGKKITKITITIDEKNRELLRHLVTGEAEIFKLVPYRRNKK